MHDAIYVDHSAERDGWKVTVTTGTHTVDDWAEGGLLAARECANTLVAATASTSGHLPGGE